jgi:hypothetical protein
MNKNIVAIIKVVLYPFTLIKHCKSSCCEFDCDTVENEVEENTHTPINTPRPSPIVSRKTIVV